MDVSLADISALGATGILGLIVILFLRGDILSRPVYEKMTENIVERVVAEIATRILAGVKELLDDMEAGRTNE